MWLAVCSRQFRTGAILGRARTTFYEKHKPVKHPNRQDPDYFENQAAALPLDEHYIDSLKMLWEEKVSNERELMLKAGDRLIGRERGDYGLPKIDPLRPKIGYEKVPELKDAPEEVKKIFSIGFGERRDRTEAWKHDLIELVRKHRYEKTSLQIQIAWTTVIIRHLSELVDEIRERTKRRPTVYTHKIYLLIGYRHKLLRLLREQNYEEFEKVLSALKISYQVPKQPEHVKTRKAWSLFLLRQRVDAEKELIMERTRMEFEKNKDEELKSLNTKLDNLIKEQEDVRTQLQKMAIIEDRKPAVVDGEYQPKLVEELDEFATNSRLFYPPTLDKKKAA